MTLWNSLIAAALLLTATAASAQDLYDLEHSREFAGYLFSARQFNDAALEYERVVFMDSTDVENWLWLARSYRLAGKPENALARLGYYSDLQPLRLDAPLSKEYGLSLLASRRFEEGRNYCATAAAMSSDAASELMLGSYLLAADWTRARHYLESSGMLNSGTYRELAALSQASLALKHKSPALAVGMSALVPGTGKIYTGEWQDGLMSLVFVASNAYQSYRGFKSDGIGSPYGWVFGALSLGFYSGNLYGTLRSARKFNQKQNEKLQHQAWHLLFDTP